jgi:hypothetical protein
MYILSELLKHYWLYLSPFIFTPGFAPTKKPICQVLAMLFCWHVPQQWEYFYHRNQSTKIDLHTRKIKKQRYTVLNLLTNNVYNFLVCWFLAWKYSFRKLQGSDKVKKSSVLIDYLTRLKKKYRLIVCSII